MNALDALGRLLAMRRSVITTREAAVRLGVSTSRASQLLGGFEKAGFDPVYLRAPGGGVALPELELPTGFQKRKAAQWVARIHRPRLRTIASRDPERILS